MKIGIRRPSLKKSISSRTIGKFKRSIKKVLIHYMARKVLDL